MQEPLPHQGMHKTYIAICDSSQGHKWDSAGMMQAEEALARQCLNEPAQQLWHVLTQTFQCHAALQPLMTLTETSDTGQHVSTERHAPDVACILLRMQDALQDMISTSSLCMHALQSNA